MFNSESVYYTGDVIESKVSDGVTVSTIRQDSVGNINISVDKESAELHIKMNDGEIIPIDILMDLVAKGRSELACIDIAESIKERFVKNMVENAVTNMNDFVTNWCLSCDIRKIRCTSCPFHVCNGTCLVKMWLAEREAEK